MKIIDVSDKYTYSNYHINGSVNIPYDELINNYRKYLNKNERYYLLLQLCNSYHHYVYRFMAGRFQYRRKGILPVDIHILFIHRQLHKIYQEKSYYREETIINCGNTICTCNLDTYLFFRYRESYYWFIVLCYSRKYCILLLDKNIARS